MIEAKIEGLDDVVQRLRALPTKLSGKNGGPVRKALFAATKVIRNQARINAPEDTGFLKTQIVASRGRRNKQGVAESYRIGIKSGKRRLAFTRRNVRSGRAGIVVTREGYGFYGRMVEFGTSKMAARPWMRPAFESKKSESVDAFTSALKKEVEKLELKK